MKQKYKQLSIGFYPEDLEKLEIISRSLNQSKAASVRELVHFFLLNVDLNNYKNDYNKIL